ncbi:DUF503 family protein [Microbacterium sp. NPDC057944]|uniref:DUF503 family protein n=1 Tax=Microbacterium sp. NPDC057944 TaxID=3346286 RepID=UPI0036D77A0B
MWIGWIEFDNLQGDVRSLKKKRGAIPPLIADLRRRTESAIAEVSAQDARCAEGPPRRIEAVYDLPLDPLAHDDVEVLGRVMTPARESAAVGGKA